MSTSNWREALARTRRIALARVSHLLGASEINEDTWKQLEAGLLQADVGPSLTTHILRTLRSEAASHAWTRPGQISEALRYLLLSMLGDSTPSVPSADRPQAWVLVGTNGSGKTTSAAKLAALLHRQGKRVLLAAADTYRAAADLQLREWADRLGLELIAGKPGSDPGAVAYEAAQTAYSRDIDVVLVDTSGRMHTSHNLMGELQKICRVTGKVLPGAPQRVLLVLDATTGQNALSQARAFTQAVGVTDILLAKLDGSAKGGAALAIHRELGLPIAYVGLGEGPEDLAPFDPQAYVEALLALG